MEKLPNTLSSDGEEIDAYVIGKFEPLESFTGYVVYLIKRELIFKSPLFYY
ncbi:hypothetical protein [Paraclostridium dentum]|uniref:hypothetical protein n=1 Tax=Paraclostridium dentum TaxID=2662455 RepID=UPI003464DB48